MSDDRHHVFPGIYRFAIGLIRRQKPFAMPEDQKKKDTATDHQKEQRPYEVSPSPVRAQRFGTIHFRGQSDPEFMVRGPCPDHQNATVSAGERKGARRYS